MLSINNSNNAYDHLGRERQVIELYEQSKRTRDIAKELRMSLRDISIILRKYHVNHGIVTTTKDNGNDNNNNETNNNKSPSQKATKAYELYDEGKTPLEVAIQLVSLSKYKATRYYREYLELTGLSDLTFLYEEKCIAFHHS